MYKQYFWEGFIAGWFGGALTIITYLKLIG